MTIEALIIWLVIGAVAGWLAGLIVKGYGFGLVGNIVVGIIGAVLAGWLLPLVGFVLVGGVIAAIINAVIGAVSGRLALAVGRICSRRRGHRGDHQRRHRGGDSLGRDRVVQKGLRLRDFGPKPPTSRNRSIDLGAMT